MFLYIYCTVLEGDMTNNNYFLPVTSNEGLNLSSILAFDYFPSYFRVLFSVI